MKQRPTLRTARLTLRPFTLDDAPAVQRLASAREVALNTLMVPHPYPEGAAEAWIGTHQDHFDRDRIVHFALDDGEVIGAMALILKPDQDMGEIGYWTGVPFWNRGYTSEAAAEVVRYAFEERGLNRVFAAHFARNPASGKVLQKLGMQYEGTLRAHEKKWGEYMDVVFYGILREEWSRGGRGR
jgi:[ribosomal protein S5]-alanine N-acetyltransferase